MINNSRQLFLKNTCKMGRYKCQLMSMSVNDEEILLEYYASDKAVVVITYKNEKTFTIMQLHHYKGF